MQHRYMVYPWYATSTKTKKGLITSRFSNHSRYNLYITKRLFYSKVSSLYITESSYFISRYLPRNTCRPIGPRGILCQYLLSHQIIPSLNNLMIKLIFIWVKKETTALTRLPFQLLQRVNLGKLNTAGDNIIQKKCRLAKLQVWAIRRSILANAPWKAQSLITNKQTRTVHNNKWVDINTSAAQQQQVPRRSTEGTHVCRSTLDSRSYKPLCYSVIYLLPAVDAERARA